MDWEVKMSFKAEICSQAYENQFYLYFIYFIFYVCECFVCFCSAQGS